MMGWNFNISTGARRSKRQEGQAVTRKKPSGRPADRRNGPTLGSIQKSRRRVGESAVRQTYTHHQRLTRNAEQGQTSATCFLEDLLSTSFSSKMARHSTTDSHSG